MIEKQTADAKKLHRMKKISKGKGTAKPKKYK